MAKTSEEYLTTGKKYLGCREGDDRHKKIVDTFNSSKLKTFSISYEDAWCAAFISSIAIECGCTDIIPISANCDEMYKKGVVMGIAIPKDKWIPKIGDIVFYDWNLNGELDHVGTVEEILSNYIIRNLEGNKNDSVAYRDINYKNATITKIIRPRYKTVSKKKTYKNYCDTAIRVINGYYGNGDDRKKKLEKDGYSYEKVQGIVDILLK